MITLWDGWAIDSDPYQYILGRPVERKMHNRTATEMKDPTYHGTLGQALRAFYRLQSRESIKENDTTLCQALVTAEDIWNRLRELVENLDADQRAMRRQHD